jgi:DNA-binding CsgD family transcriptional regulator
MAQKENKPGRKLIAKQRQIQACELRMQGLSYSKIAKIMGVPLNTAYFAAQRALKELNEKSSEAAEEYRTLTAMRLDALLAAIWDDAIGGDTTKIETALKILKQQSALFGLDAPKRIDLQTTQLVELLAISARADELQVIDAQFETTEEPKQLQGKDHEKK